MKGRHSGPGGSDASLRNSRCNRRNSTANRRHDCSERLGSEIVNASTMFSNAIIARNTDITGDKFAKQFYTKVSFSIFRFVSGI